MPAAESAELSANVAIGLCACAAICWRFSADISTHWRVAARTREPAWSAPPRGIGCCPARTPCRSACGGVSVPAEPGTESVSDCFLGYSYVSFLFCALLAHVFSIERYEKSPSRRARELLCIFRWYDFSTLL